MKSSWIKWHDKFNYFSPLYACFLADGAIVITYVDVVVARDKRINVCCNVLIMNIILIAPCWSDRYTNSQLVKISQQLKKERSWLVRPPFWRVVVLLSVKVCTCCMYVYSGMFSSHPQAIMFDHRQVVAALQWLTGLNCIACAWVPLYLAVIESLRWCCYTKGGFAVLFITANYVVSLLGWSFLCWKSCLYGVNILHVVK